jgi:hypothetical protein
MTPEEGRSIMTRQGKAASTESGFALVLAIMSLMLLTFLGLTLATTTSTELQIATNYRWSQQALYNAEAGLEAAKLLLATAAESDGDWRKVVPAARAPWQPPPDGATPAQPAAPTAAPATAGRDFERAYCDQRYGAGYGGVLRAGGQAWENVSEFDLTGSDPKPINGAFTIWLRREVVPAAGLPGYLQDDQAGSPVNIIVTSEGVAPFIGASTAFTRANQATRVLQMTFNLVVGDPCVRQGTQEGAGPTGENFDACSPLTDGAGGSLETVFGGRGGTLEEF